MKGRRIYPNDDDQLSFAPGDYGKDVNGVWFGRPPDPDVHMGSFENHGVTEHEDGSISVLPSILIHKGQGRPEWHGFLERGIWRKA